jgi:multimeric flavodoxin WrbA
MKVVAFNGSPRKNGNTTILVEYVLHELQNEGIEIEHIRLAGKDIHGCRACYQCARNKDQRCSVKDDALNEYIEKMLEAHGIILASPTYFADVSTEIKALIDRAGLVAKVNGDMFRRKVGAAVVAVRRAGATHVFSSINYFFLINQMIVPGASYWNLGVGHDRGDVEKDAEGVQTMKALGSNMAWLLKKLSG